MMPIPSGTTIGRYRLEHLLGAGGMGHVYAARDLQLGRLVALKVLTSTDSSRVERFIREAQLASSLNHPAIISVHDAGEADGVHYLAMELVNGQTLDVWARGARDLNKIIEVFTSVADGLARAHAGGIVHRDLKPQNIMVSRDGHPKILDFGVAKLAERDPTIGSSDTAPAQAMGTAAYMSPEQVEGLDVDARSDIFSFGAVMVQALTGKSPFERGKPVESMHAVLQDEPAPIGELRPNVPATLQRVVRKCLTKDREERYQSIKDVAIDLREVTREKPAPAERRRRVLWPTLAALLVIALVGTTYLLTRENPRGALVAQPNAPQPVMLRMTNTGNIAGGAITPDGNYIVYATIDGEEQTLWVKQIATGTSVRIIPPQRVYYRDLRVSPDGNYVYYALAQRNEPNIANIAQISVLGGQSRLVAADVDGQFALSRNGRSLAFIRFNAMERLIRLTTVEIESGRESILLSRPYPGLIGSMTWDPNGTSITFIGAKKTPSPGKNIEELRPGLFSIDVRTRNVSEVPCPDWPGLGPIVWLPDRSGMIITASDRQQPRQIWFLPAGSTTGRKITSDISMYGGISVTADSRSIVTHRADVTQNIWVVDVQDPSKPRALTTGLGNCNGGGGVRWMPDGRILYTGCNPAPSLKVIGREGGEPREFARGAADWHPVVSPDGKRLAVVSDRSGREELWVSDISGNDFKQVTHQGPVGFPSWMPDGQSLVYLTRGTEQAVWRVWLDGRTERILARPTFFPVVSPDGKRLLCRLRSLDPKATPLWRTAIVPLDDPSNPRFLPVPRHGGPPRLQWVGDGRTFAYLDAAGGVANIWFADVRGGEPRQVTRFDSGDIFMYDVSRDGRLIALSHGEQVNDLVLIRDFR